MYVDASGRSARVPLSGILWQKGAKAGREGAKCRGKGSINRR